MASRSVIVNVHVEQFTECPVCFFDTLAVAKLTCMSTTGVGPFGTMRYCWRCKEDE